MITANELYKLEPIDISTGVYETDLCYIQEHLYEFDRNLPYDLNTSSLDFEIKVIKDHCYDGRRTWTLKTVWYGGCPFMIVQNAGREGDDHQDRFITNKDVYIKFVLAIQALLVTTEEHISDVIDPNEPWNDLDRFYGQSLSETFEYY